MSCFSQVKNAGVPSAGEAAKVKEARQNVDFCVLIRTRSRSPVRASVSIRHTATALLRSPPPLYRSLPQRSTASSAARCGLPPHVSPAPPLTDGGTPGCTSIYQIRPPCVRCPPPQFADEAFLAPVVEGDPLLFSMDFPEDEAGDEETAPQAGAWGPCTHPTRPLCPPANAQSCLHTALRITRRPCSMLIASPPGCADALPTFVPHFLSSFGTDEGGAPARE